jgi:hypothetical protein
MQMFDQKVPKKLKKTQIWFGSIIGRPMDEDSRMNPLSPSGQSLELEAAHYIKPSPTLRPAQRIEIYNQQYWWRLLSTLQEAFPLVTRLFGYHDFNKSIAIPYLMKYPPLHWSLNYLGDNMPQWADSNYQGDDRAIVCNSIHLDAAFGQAFIAPQSPPITAENLPVPRNPISLLDKLLTIQPHISLFKWPYNLIDFRNEILKQDPEYWLENDFPKLQKGHSYYFVLYRNPQNQVACKEISEGEYDLLSQFKKGTSIEKACEWLETQNKEIFQEAMSLLSRWLENWIVLNWLTYPSNQSYGPENTIQRP